jgi:hypothetical protein
VTYAVCDGGSGCDCGNDSGWERGCSGTCCWGGKVGEFIVSMAASVSGVGVTAATQLHCCIDGCAANNAFNSWESVCSPQCVCCMGDQDEGAD